MIKTKTFLPSSMALVLAACAAPPKFDWVKEGVSQHEKVNNFSECSYQIKLNKTPVAEQQELLKLCMQGKGFRYRQVN